MTNIRTAVTISMTCAAILLQGCYAIRPSDGGAQTENDVRRVRRSDIALPAGYQAEAVATGLTFPTGITFDDDGDIYVVESGYSYGETWDEPRLLRVEPSGETRVIATGNKNGPWTGVTYHDGRFFIAEGGVTEGGRILSVDEDGDVTVLIEDLPTRGDHHTNGPIVWNGYVYFGQGTATNSGVVGEDNASFGWLKRHPEFHDIPCKDIVLRGRNFETPNVLTPDDGDKVMTGAFVKFGSTTTPGQVIRGAIPCSGSILRIPVQGGSPELVAWGFRNPFGLAVHDGRLFVTDNGYDVRGSRPAWGTGDLLWEVRANQWYGWPDYSGDQTLNSEFFKVPGKDTTGLLLMETPGTPPEPVAVLAVHSSSNGIDFSSSDRFGYKGKAFIAQLGDMAPNVGKVLEPVGFKVIMVDIERGVITDFAVNKGKKNAPASALGRGGLERPVDVKFSRDGSALYVVDFGVITISEGKTMPMKGTGVIWKITKSSTE